MAEDGVFPVDKNPGRWLVFTAGGVLSEAGVQAMLTSQTIPLTYTAPLTAIGVLLVLVGVFWKKLRIDRTAFAQRMNEIGSDPRVWIAFVVLVWLSFTALSIVKEIARNNEITALRNDDQSLANVVNRLVMPRHLTPRQQRTISNFLLRFEPHEFAFQLPNRDEEASSYRADIEQALLKGGWTRYAQNPYEYMNPNDVPEGVSINFIQTQEHSQKPEDPKNPKTDSILMMALGLAGVRLDSSQGGSGVNITQDRLIIGIGRRRMDSYQLTLPED